MIPKRLPNGRFSGGEPSFWSAGRVARIVAMSKDGYSASEIGADLGCTRNAVIGKLHRMGMRWKATPRHNGWRPHKTRVAPPQGEPEPIQLREDTMELETQEVHDPPAATPAGGILIWQLEARHCRWPVEGEGAKMRYCGAPKQFSDKPYCALHHDLAHS